VCAGVPLLGICLGLQWLFDGSTEARGAAGLGLVPGLCQRLDAPKVPHVGWNSLAFPRRSRLMANIAEGAQVYFTHSYAAPIVDVTVATTTYGTTFSAAIERDNIAAVQFHPEKSGDVGLRILRNWLEAWDVRPAA
jgi:glutamine amidotransferase